MRLLQEYGFDVHLLMAIKSLHSQPEVCVCVNRQTIKVISCRRWSSAKMCFCTSPFHNLQELDEQANPNRLVGYFLKII